MAENGQGSDASARVSSMFEAADAECGPTTSGEAGRHSTKVVLNLWRTFRIGGRSLPGLPSARVPHSIRLACTRWCAERSASR